MSVLLNRPARSAPHGICHWLPSAANGNRRLCINGTDYEIAEVDGGLALYTVKGDGVVRYTIDRTLPRYWQCSCPDATYRHRECKHVLSIRAALAALPF
jgi:hypothetical protein